MDNTVQKTLLESHWDTKFEIYELKQFGDSRGMVCETFRIDDTILKDSKMCYISETSPFILRGPHEHKNQTDFFVSWKTQMIYHMYNPDIKEFKYFVTDPSKIYLVKVSPGIIHSYRNISLSCSKTLNYPTSLFMGENKKDDIDEIRHENRFEKNMNIVVLGAYGRLGKSIVKKLFSNVGDHTYNVIPVYEHINESNMNILFDKIPKSSTIIINCIAKTNVQSSDDTFTFPNYIFPKVLTEFCVSQKIYLVQFSTDYVYQTGELSKYTQSKIQYERWFDEYLDSVLFMPTTDQTVKHYIKIIRLANLFSLEDTDIHNVISKLFDKCKNPEDIIVVPKHLKLMPTDVNEISNFLVEKYIFNIDTFGQYLNLAGKAYTLQDILVNFFGLDSNRIENLAYDKLSVINNPDVYLDSKHYLALDCDDAIISKIKQMRI